MAAIAHLSRRALRASRPVLAVLALGAAFAGPADASAYGWPLKPFDRQHPIRGFFGDPRGDDTGHQHLQQLHTGVDISAPNGTPVYATLTGRVVEAPFPGVVVVRSGDTAHSNWHVVPAVRAGALVVAGRTRIGAVEAPWEHVHFSELVGGVYVNPLRRGALAPYADTTRPVIRHVDFERAGRGVGRRVRGPVDLVAEVADEQPLATPSPWTGKPVMPALVRWRILDPRRAAVPWTTAVDLRGALPAVPVTSVFARWTRQNHPWEPGRYRVYLSRAYRCPLRDGRYRLEVEVADTRGNSSRSTVAFAVDSRRPGGRGMTEE